MSDWPTEWSDDELMAALAEAIQEDPAADRRRDAARAAFTWRTVDEELAQLLHDSALDAGAAVRSGSDAPRMLSFGRSGLSLELEYDAADRVVTGQVIPEGDAASGISGGAVVVLQRDGSPDREVVADGSGFFRVAEVEAGPVRFVVRQQGWTLTTPWVAL